MQYARHQWDGKQCVLLGFALCAMLLPYLSRVHAQMCSPMEAAKLLADDGQATDLLGISVAISGDVVVAGAYGHGENGAVSGAAYVYRFNGSEWLQEMELLASDGAAGDQFGTSVAIEGDVVVVGAPFEDENGIDAGAAYAYRFDGTNWVQQQKLLDKTNCRFDVVTIENGDDVEWIKNAFE